MAILPKSNSCVHANDVPQAVPLADPKEMMILGLEFDKMLSDTSMYNDQEAEKIFVKHPIARSMEAIGDFTQTNPSVVVSRLFGEPARHWPKVKPDNHDDSATSLPFGCRHSRQ